MDRRRQRFEKGREELRNGLEARGEGRLDEAIQHYLVAISHFEFADQTQAAVIAINNLAAARQIQGRSDDAASRYRDALQRAEAAGDNPGAALSCGNLGALHLDTGDLVRAEILIGRALELYTALDDASGRANQLGNLGLIASRRGDLDAARDRMTQAAGAFLTAGNLLGAGRTFHAFGEFARQQGDRASATDAFERARELLERVGDQIGLAGTLRGLGQLALRSGDVESARTLFSQGTELHRAAGDRRGEGAAQLDLANVLGHLDQNTEALDTQMKAADIARQIGDREGLAGALLSASNSLILLGKLKDAGDATKSAMTLYQAIDNPRGTANAVAIRARLNIARGELAAADEDLKRAREIAAKGGFDPLLAAITGMGALLFQSRGQITQTRAALLEASALYEAVGSPSGRHNAALASLELDAWADALADLDAALADPRLTEARDFFEETGQKAALTAILRLEAVLCRCFGDHDRGDAILKAARVSIEAADRQLDRIAIDQLIAEMALRSGRAPQNTALLAVEARDIGAIPRAIFCGLLSAQAHLQADEVEAARVSFEAWDKALGALSEAPARCTSMRLDTLARLLEAEGDRTGAQSAAEDALARYEACEDRVCARELREALGL